MTDKSANLLLRPWIPLVAGAILTCLACSGAALAADPPTALETAHLFGTETGDAFTSVFLNQLFGPLFPSANHSEATTVFSSIIGYFNVLTLVVGGVLFFYNATIGMLQSAHEGVVLGQRWSSLWAPIRVIFAVGLLVPVPNLGGYNLAQAGIAFLVKGSTNIASAVWVAAASMIMSLETPVSTAGVSLDPTTVKTIYMNMACKQIVNYQLAQAAGKDANGRQRPGLSVVFVEDPITAEGVQTMRSWISGSDGKLTRPDICGSYATPELPNYISQIIKTNGIQGVPDANRENVKNEFIGAHHTSMAMVQRSMDSLTASMFPAVRDAGQPLPNAADTIAGTVQDVNEFLSLSIETLMDTAVGADRKGQAARDAMLARIEGSDCVKNKPEGKETEKCYGEGWIGAGSWYMFIVQLNNEISSLTNARSAADNGSYIEDVSAGNRDLYLAAGGETAAGWLPWTEDEDGTQALIDGTSMASAQEAAFWNSRYEQAFDESTRGLAALGFELSSDTLEELKESTTADDLLSAIPGFRSNMLWLVESVVTFVSPQNWGSDPMIGLSNIGDLLFITLGCLMVLATVTGFATGGSIVSFMMPIIAVMFAAASTLTFILPILPFLYWVLAVTGYFLLIVEAVVAVNLFAIGHMRLDGEGVSGHGGERGWLMILALTMTPVLMIFGFLIGMGIFRVSSMLIGIGIRQALTGILNGNLMTQLIAVVVYAVLIAMFYVTLLERSFSLVTEFPGKVLQWMGMNADLRGGESQARTAAMVSGAGSAASAGGFGKALISGARAIGIGARKVKQRGQGNKLTPG
ncbi:DotA/TraY family protein [Cereibacter sphaeroides]|uniref:DotA/TraY family protein n=1 Tax=Cereibacter sphaeroides TaxID=1063 RepID=UPI001F40BE4A|nr:DotA/TraY family protein [Cereibacter sphaeroides]MCE6959691.1 DotA/TraY family protein [Cereibacter sphaeroides]MCE6974448.1 DotA/TraY family protein [Cereibacter sphaeroides]